MDFYSLRGMQFEHWGWHMEYPTVYTPSKAPNFLHEFDTRITPGRRWEPGMVISRKPEVKDIVRTPRQSDFPKTGVMRPC
jgi:hypothetical protein